MKIRRIQRNFSDNSENGDAAIYGGLTAGAAGGLGALAYKISAAKKIKKALKETGRLSTEALEREGINDLLKEKQAITEALKHEEGKTGWRKLISSAKSKRKELNEINSKIKSATGKVNALKHARIEEILAKNAKSTKRAKIAAAAAAAAGIAGVGTGLVQKRLEEKEFGLKAFFKKLVGRGKPRLTPKERQLTKELNQKISEVNKANKKIKNLEQRAKSREDSNTMLNKLVKDIDKENAALREESKAAKESAKAWKRTAAGTAIGGLGLGAIGGYELGS